MKRKKKKALLEVAGVLKIEHGKNHAVRCEIVFDRISILQLKSYLTDILQEILSVLINFIREIYNFTVFKDMQSYTLL